MGPAWIYPQFSFFRKATARWGAALVVLLAAMSAVPAAIAQVSFAGSQIVVASHTLASPVGLATDGQNNLYLADRDNGRVLRIALTASGYAAPVAIANGLASPQGVAVDWSGSIFVAEAGNNRVLMFPANQGVYGMPIVVSSGLNGPCGVAVDPAGNVYVADTGNNRVLAIPYLGNGYGAGLAIGTGFKNPMAVAVDAIKNVYVADTGNSRVIKFSLKAGVYGVQQTFTHGNFTPTAVALDKNYNLYVADSQNHLVQKYPWFALVGYYYPPFTIGGDFATPSGITVDSLGRTYVADLSRNQVELLQPSSAAFGSLPVGSESDPQRYDFNISAGTALGNIAIYSRGVTSQDYVDAGDSTCTQQTYAVATLCVVSVVFQPKISGLRTGAIVLYDANGTALATAYLSGTGVQPKAAMFPGQAVNLGNQLSGPSGVAVDGSGNLYIADTGNDRVVELPWTGGSYAPQVTLPLTGVSSPMGMAFDGAGNLYIASNDNDKVIKLPWTGSGFGKQQTVGTGLYGPIGVSVDSGGNVLIADTFANSVRKVPWTGNAYGREQWAANYSILPVGVAGDQYGDIFFTMPYSNTLIEKPMVNGVLQPQFGLRLNGVSFPAGIALDGNSNLYLVDTANNQVVMLPWTGTGFGAQVTVAKGLNAPTAIALDDAGNLYIADTGNDTVVKIDVSANSSLSFKTTNVGSTSVDSPGSLTLQNVGLVPLQLDDITYPPDFPSAANAISLCTPGTSLVQGAHCSFAIDFFPQVPGSPLSEQAMVTDNEGNVPGNQRIISLAGTAIGKAQQTITFPPISDTVFGAPILPLTAVSSSGLAVTYQVMAGPATLISSRSSLQITGAGLVTVLATQAGNSAYNPATPVTVNFNVLQATLTVTPVDTMAAYGSLPSSFSYNITGFVNGQLIWQVIQGKAVVTTNATSNAGTGTYTLTASLGTLSAANYNFIFATGRLTITPAPLQVKSVPTSSIYGSAIPSLTWVVSGLKNGDASGVLTGAPTLTTTANSGSPVGTYPISISAGSLQTSNYSFQFVSGTLTVLPATLLIAASNQTSTYGGVIPALTWSITGLVQGDSQNAVAGKPVIAAQATAGSAVGTYSIAISVGTLSALNYKFQFQNGQLVIQKAPITVTASSVSIVYGQALPAYSCIIAGFVNGDTQASSISGVPSLTSTATRISRPAIFAITAAVGSLTARNYSFTFVNGALTINKATVTIAPRPTSIVYGGTIPAIAYDISGFVFGDGQSSISGQATFSTTATSSSPVGTYTLTGIPGSLTSDSYLFNFVNGTLQIQKAVLTITPLSSAATYGGSVPALTYTLNGFVNGEDASVVTGQPNLVTTATSSSPAGTYLISSSAGTLTAANYTFLPATGKLTINKAHITVTPDCVFMTYGGAVPRLTYKLTGFVNGDTSTVVSGSPFLWTTAPAKASVGNYSINGTPGNLSAISYTFAIASASFTVNKAVLTVSVASAVITYGQTAPMFSYTITGFVNGESVEAIRGTASLSSSYTQSSPAGVYPIVADVGMLTAANYTFQAVNGNLTVNKSQLVVTPVDSTMVYGSQLPQLTYAVTGFLHGDNSSMVSGSASVTSTARPTSNVGVYPILVDISTLSALNYTFTKVQGKLVVTKAPLTVTPNAISMTYGGVVPRLSYQISGLLNGDPATVVLGAPSLTVSIPEGAPVGNYGISGTPGTMSAVNYTFVVGAGTLTIQKAVLTVAAAPASMIYGGVVPPLSYKVTGYVHGEGTTVIRGNPVLATDCSSLSPAGACAITVSQGTLSADNYTFQTVSGVMTVNKAVLTLTPTNVSMIYGARVPLLTYSMQGFLNGDNQANSTTGSAQLTTSALSNSPVGQYDIVSSTGTLAATNYSFVGQTGKVSITQAPLTVTADNQSMKVGATLPPLTFTATGFVNGDTPASATTGSPTLSTSASSTSTAGTYAIAITKGTMSAANYQLSFRGGTMTVSK